MFSVPAASVFEGVPAADNAKPNANLERLEVQTPQAKELVNMLYTYVGVQDKIFR